MATLEERVAALEQEIAAIRRIVNGVSPGTEPKAKAKRAHALPADWQPRDQDVASMRTAFPNVDIPHETDSFRDYWTSRGTALKDWDAAFRNWIRKASTFAKASVTPLQGRPAGRAAAIGEGNRARVNGALDKLAALQQAAGARASEE